MVTLEGAQYKLADMERGRGRGRGQGQGVRRTALREATPATEDALVVAVVIAKGALYRGRGAGSAWRLSVRDGSGTANCTAWGTWDFCSRLCSSFALGDVVDIIRPRFKARVAGDRGEQYAPEVSLPLSLVISENLSDMVMHGDGEDALQLSLLIHVPTKPPGGCYPLAHLLNSGRDIREDHVDLLVGVTAVLATRHVRTRTGGEAQHREVIVCDQSTEDNFRISVWDPDTITRISSWTPRDTVLFIADVKLEWSDFHESPIGRIDRRTIITEDPYTSEAETLRIHMQHAPEKVTRAPELKFPDVDSIKNVMTVQQIKDRVNSLKEYNRFTAVLYATITDLDLDGPGKCVAVKCSNCSTILKSATPCQNGECHILNNQSNSYDFYVRVSLSDYTGTLNCKLTGIYADQILGCTASEFTKLSMERRGQIKWARLMERQIIKVVICKGPLVYIVSCSRADPNELITKLPIY